MTAKTKRDRAAGRRHRHTAIQTIKDNHEGIIDDIARIDISIAELHNTTCYLNTRLIVWHDRLEEQNDYTRQNVAHAMQRVARNERKQAEVESAVGILQESSKEHQADIAILNHTSKEHKEAIAQLTAYVNKVHGKQVALNQEINLLQAEVDDTNRRLFQLAWINHGIWFAAALTIFILLITTH
jgi:chromosome segregation ATPase